MAVVPYFGAYARFTATDRGQGALLLGADCLIGDELNCVWDREGPTEVVWLENRFGGRCGKLDASATGQMALCRAKEWNTHVLLASVYGTSDGDELNYWGEVVILAYPASNAASFDVFVAGIAELLGNGARPQVELQQSSLSQILETDGTWLPSGRVAALRPEGSALVKDHLGFNDKMIEAARRRNPGCMAVGWAFIVLLVVGAAWLVKSLLGF